MSGTEAFQKFVQKLGAPNWDRTLEFFDVDGIKTLLIPVVSSKKQSVTALIVMNYIKDNSYYQFIVVERGKFIKAENNKHMSDVQFEGLFAALDKEILNVGNSKGFYKEPRKGTSTSNYYTTTTTSTCWASCTTGYNGMYDCSYTCSVSNSYSYTGTGSTGGSETSSGYYSGGGGSSTAPATTTTTATREISTVDVVQPCMLAVLNQTINAGLRNDITRLVRETFNRPDDMTLKFSQTTGLASNIGGTTTASDYVQRVELNANIMPNSSKEYIAETIFHESFHAYLNTTPISKNELTQHIEMGRSYVRHAVTALNELFPTMLEKDAKSLILAGFGNVQDGNPVYFNQLLTENGLTLPDLISARDQYKGTATTKATKGTLCP